MSVGTFADEGSCPSTGEAKCALVSPHPRPVTLTELARRRDGNRGQSDRERIVNSPPLRYSFVINEAFPALGDFLMRTSGVVQFQRTKADREHPRGT